MFAFLAVDLRGFGLCGVGWFVGVLLEGEVRYLFINFSLPPPAKFQVASSH